MQKFIINITDENLSLLDDSNAECFILNSNLSRNFIKQFAQKAKEKDKLVLTEQEELCSENNLDGVILDLSKSENIEADYKNLTRNLKNKIIGAICRNRRHEAMLLSECEPDFIIFKAWKDGAEKVIELTQWYNEFFLIQSALLPVDKDIDIANFKTDFVIFDDTEYKILVAN